jgi:hypothetical protein
MGSLAGCADDTAGTDPSTATDRGTVDGSTQADEPDTGTGTDGTGDRESPGTRTTETGTAADLDLREANVVGVELDEASGAVRFDVTLYHDDDGEDGYANWWQVETLDGDQLGRRDLLHAHSTDPFTRSETIEVPADVNCVVVRGHDQTHGYGGQALTVAVETGTTAAVRQGPEPESVSTGGCP